MKILSQWILFFIFLFTVIKSTAITKKNKVYYGIQEFKSLPKAMSFVSRIIMGDEMRNEKMTNEEERSMIYVDYDKDGNMIGLTKMSTFQDNTKITKIEIIKANGYCLLMIGTVMLDVSTLDELYRANRTLSLPDPIVEYYEKTPREDSYYIGIDIDDTLIHKEWDKSKKTFEEKVYLRPGVREFLTSLGELQEKFENVYVVFYSAGNRDHVHYILGMFKKHDLLDKLKFGIIAREHFYGAYNEEEPFKKHLSWLKTPGVPQTDKESIKNSDELKRFMLIDNDKRNAHEDEESGLVLVPDFYAREKDDNILKSFSTIINDHMKKTGTLTTDGFQKLREELRECSAPKTKAFEEKMKHTGIRMYFKSVKIIDEYFLDRY